jgi:hypothetical protein
MVPSVMPALALDDVKRDTDPTLPYAHAIYADDAAGADDDADFAAQRHAAADVVAIADHDGEQHAHRALPPTFDTGVVVDANADDKHVFVQPHARSHSNATDRDSTAHVTTTTTTTTTAATVPDAVASAGDVPESEPSTSTAVTSMQVM